MRLIKTADTQTLNFNEGPFLKLVANTVRNEQKFDGKYSAPLEPWIGSEKPRVHTKRLLHKEYEITVYNFIAENYGDPNKDNHILQTKTTFIYTNQKGISKKMLFEHLLIQTDQYTTSHFFSNLDQMKNKLWAIEPRIAATLEDFEFLLPKLGTKYRPFPNIDHEEFFAV